MQSAGIEQPGRRSLEELSFDHRVCFFTGENGTGKSTLLEAIAVHYGFGREGGTRSFANDSTESNHSIDPLVKALRLSFDKRTGAGYYLRTESFFNAASYIDEIGVTEFYGYKSLHSRSHGETFHILLELKFQRNGLFLLDEPEAALSSQRQFSLLVLLNDVHRKHRDPQFIISTHSPILLGFPDAQIMSFDAEKLQRIAYDQTVPFTLVKRFLNDSDRFLKKLFNEPSMLFDSPARDQHD